MIIEIKIWNFKKLVHSGEYQFKTEDEARNYALGLYNGFELAGKKVTGFATKIVKGDNSEYEDNILMIPISHFERIDLEKIAGDKFENREELEKLFCFDEDNPMENEKLCLYTLSEFMDVCNDNDSETLEDERIGLDSHWVGFVRIKK